MDETQNEETIQELSFKLMLEQNKNDNILNGPTERTIFMLGSKGVVSIFRNLRLDRFKRS